MNGRGQLSLLSNYQFPPPRDKSAWEIREKLGESDSMVLEAPVTLMGYTGGGAQ